jgi:hypothetical protein
MRIPRAIFSAVVFSTFLLATSSAQNNFSQHSYPAIGGELQRGDFNHDGKPDLLGNGGNGFYVLLNNGDGTFHGPLVTSHAEMVSHLVMTDFNRDGNPDIAACTAVDPSSSTADAAIWMGNGAGGFSSSRHFTITGNCQDVAAADFDNDGNQDVAVVWQVWNPDFSPNNGITVFFGNGTGTLDRAVTTSNITVNSGNGPCAFASAVVSGNYDRSGSPDLMIGTICPGDAIDHGVIVFAQGSGTGNFGFSIRWNPVTPSASSSATM